MTPWTVPGRGGAQTGGGGGGGGGGGSPRAGGGGGGGAGGGGSGEEREAARLAAAGAGRAGVRGTGHRDHHLVRLWLRRDDGRRAQPVRPRQAAVRGQRRLAAHHHGLGRRCRPGGVGGRRC